MKRRPQFLLAWLGVSCLVLAQPVDPFASGSQPIRQTPQQKDVEARVGDLLRKMTLEEKLDLLGGRRGFYTLAVDRLGIPALKMADGPMGVRNYGPSTAYPAGIGLAATWDTAMAHRIGAAMGQDARARGVNILLAPAVNIYRVPVNGRNFEYYGEDPFLAGQTAASFIQGVQSQGVIATVKHFALNNQEYQRGTISAEVDERTMHEIYLPAFRAAVQQGKVWAVMASYNRINGTYATANELLETQILKKEWGFRGILMSDWGAAHDGIADALAGLDLEMPAGKFMNREILLPAVKSGQVPESVIDDKVRRILRAAISMGFFDRPPEAAPAPFDSPESDHVALEGARESIVLLKNANHTLPLDRQRIHSIAVFGPNAHPAVNVAGGSARVVPFHDVSARDALAAAGLQVDYVPFVQRDAAAVAEYPAEVALAAKDDAAVVCVGFKPATESEGFDRTFALPPGQNELIAAVARANPRTIVVINSGGAVDMTAWVDQAAAVLQAWYPGQEGGQAVADLLFGVANPSGKLPASFERHWGDSSADANYPGSDGKVFYKEGIFVGYRQFDRSDVKPLFPFGYGLSYTSFAYSGLRLDQRGTDVRVHFSVKNSGARPGAEVAEVYVQEVKPKVPRPLKELKSFARVNLPPGVAKEVEVDLDRSAFSYYDVAAHAWQVDPGEFRILVGTSSAEIRLTASLKIH
jgi:beta-glucosidase